MRQLINPDGSPGCFISDETNVSNATICSDPSTTINGTSVLIGNFVIKNSSLTDVVLDSKNEILSGGEIFDSTISNVDFIFSFLEVCRSTLSHCSSKISGSNVSSRPCAISIMDSKIEGKNADDNIFFKISNNGDFSFKNCFVSGDIVFSLHEGCFNAEDSTIVCKDKLYDDLSFNCNFSVCENCVAICGTIIKEKGRIFCCKGKPLSISNSLITNLFQASGGEVSNSEISSVFTTSGTATISDSKIKNEKGIPFNSSVVNIFIAKSVISEQCHFSLPMRFCFDWDSIEIFNCLFKGSCKILVSGPSKYTNTDISENACVDSATIEDSSICGNAKIHLANISFCDIGGSAMIGFDPFGQEISYADIITVRQETIVNRLDFITIVSKNNELITFKKNGRVFRHRKIEKQTEDLVALSMKVKNVSERLAVLYPESAFANKSFDINETAYNSVFASQKKYSGMMSEKMIESIVLYDFLDIETELTRHSPSKYAVSWLYSFDKGAILDIKTKKIVGYDVVCPSELLDTIIYEHKKHP